MKKLQREAINYFPYLNDIIKHESVSSRSVWESELKSGKALEFLTMLAVIDEIAYFDCEVKIHDRFKIDHELYYLRNEIPYHHGSQAGHDSVVNSDFTMEERFLSAILPRASFICGDKNYLLFREGNPLHQIETTFLGGTHYKERPDLVIVEGNLTDIEIEKGALTFSHVSKESSATIQLSIKNSNFLPLRNYVVQGKYEVITTGIIECSVSKTQRHVNNQLELYRDIFASESNTPKCLFIHGEPSQSKFSNINIDMQNLVSEIRNGVSRSTLVAYLHSVMDL